MKLTVKAYAKINLMLDLTAVLSNGYHSIYTVMQSVGIYDTVTVEKTSGGQITLTCSDENIPCDKSNTAWKAAEYFFEAAEIPDGGVNIHINKTIPSQAGMAGGSADAAAVITALNKLYDNHFSERKLNKIGEKVGADVPFCISGGTALCLNKGEVIAKLPDIPECSILVVKPNQGVSTKAAYKAFDDADFIRHPDKEGFLFAATQRDLKKMCQKSANVFEQVVEIRDRVNIKALMRGSNALMSMMTGSGAAVFGIFEDKKDAESCEGIIKKSFEEVFLTEPVKQGLAFI